MRWRTGLVNTTVALVVSALIFASATADEVGTMTTFVSGERALASEVNANFAALRDAVNDNDRRLDSLEGTPAANLGGSGLLVDSDTTVSIPWLPATSTHGLRFDASGMHSALEPQFLTVPQNGVYSVSTHVYVSDAPVGKYDVRLSIPGASTPIDTGHGAGVILRMSGTQLVNLQAGDQISVTIRHDAGIAVQVSPLKISVHRVASAP